MISGIPGQSRSTDGSISPNLYGLESIAARRERHPTLSGFPCCIVIEDVRFSPGDRHHRMLTRSGHRCIAYTHPTLAEGHNPLSHAMSPRPEIIAPTNWIVVRKR